MLIKAPQKTKTPQNQDGKMPENYQNNTKTEKKLTSDQKSFVCKKGFIRELRGILKKGLNYAIKKLV
ncbi:hypothetical protein, partial [Flavobacterium hydrophilum]